MRVSCPACNAELSLDVLLAHEEARAAMGRLVQSTMGSLVLRYLALFRPTKRRLSIERTVSLLLELLPDMERNAITRKGRDWPVTAETWRAGFEQVLANRDKGSLTPPLTSHGYLYEVLVALADKVEAKAERETEASRRSGSSVGGAPASLGQVIADMDRAVERTQQAVERLAQGPSRAALAIKAEIAARAAKKGATDGNEQD
jgi:hypothetical protein